MKKVIERFEVKDADGKVYDAVIYQTQIDTTTKEDKHRTFMGGLKEVRLSDGRAMNRIDDNTFVIVPNGKTVTRV